MFLNVFNSLFSTTLFYWICRLVVVRKFKNYNLVKKPHPWGAIFWMFLIGMWFSFSLTSGGVQIQDSVEAICFFLIYFLIAILPVLSRLKACFRKAMRPQAEQTQG